MASKNGEMWVDHMVAILDVGSRNTLCIFPFSYPTSILNLIMMCQSGLWLLIGYNFQDGCRGGHFGCWIWTKNHLDLSISLIQSSYWIHIGPSKRSGVIKQRRFSRWLPSWISDLDKNNLDLPISIYNQHITFHNDRLWWVIIQNFVYRYSRWLP